MTRITVPPRGTTFRLFLHSRRFVFTGLLAAILVPFVGRQLLPLCIPKACYFSKSTHLGHHPSHRLNHALLHQLNSQTQEMESKFQEPSLTGPAFVAPLHRLNSFAEHFGPPLSWGSPSAYLPGQTVALRI